MFQRYEPDISYGGAYSDTAYLKEWPTGECVKWEDVLAFLHEVADVQCPDSFGGVQGRLADCGECAACRARAFIENNTDPAVS